MKKITKRTIDAIKKHVAELDTMNALRIDYMMLEHENRIIVICTNHKFKSMPEETISFNRINGKWDWGCRSSGFTSSYQEKKLYDNLGMLCIYDRYEEIQQNWEK